MQNSNRDQGDRDSKPGKDLEVAVQSFLLMARCREGFSLDQLCEKGGRGVGLHSLTMRSGSEVMLKTLDSFPAVQGECITSKEVQPW